MFRLKELRLETGMKRSELSAVLNIHQNTLANYENETRQAPYELLIVFANFFDVSIDYLLGRDQTKNTFRQEQQPLPLSAKERELICCYRECDGKARQRIMEYARLWQGKTDE